MKTFKLKDMIKGWFVGNIIPTSYDTTACEVAYKQYKSGEYSLEHYHVKATEITLICHGKVKMNNEIYETGDIIVIEPNDITNFMVIENTSTVVVKVPSVAGDKFEIQ